MSNKTAASPSERAIKVACERLQWGESTPSAFVLEWARTLDYFARVEVLRGRFQEAETWFAKEWGVIPWDKIAANPSGYVQGAAKDAAYIERLQRRLKEAEEGD